LIGRDEKSALKKIESADEEKKEADKEAESVDTVDNRKRKIKIKTSNTN
jgi:hypothetical protein